jgi:hypothetical protein
MITAKILLDSIHRSNSRLTTFELTYPRFIHSEIMTHRALSKNSASSRAIPLKRMIQNITTCPAIPEYWGAEQKGMQSGDHLDPDHVIDAADVWIRARFDAVAHAQELANVGVHKSLCNRIIEPFSHITIILTGEKRGLQHFFALRAHPAAMPEFQVLAYRMLNLWMKSIPTCLQDGEWHIPFDEPSEPNIFRRLAIATGRIARVSFLNHDGKRDLQSDLDLHGRLLEGDPPHMSPFEHCAMASPHCQEGNFGPQWLQYRKTIAREFTHPLWSPGAAMARKPSWITL